MAAQVEPRDRHRDDDSQENGASQANRRQPAIERNVRPERQAIRAEHFEQPIPEAPTARPSNPPSTVRSSVSTITWLTTCRRLAPIDRRIAISFMCPLARISSRLTRFTAPMSRRNNAPPCINQRVGRIART